MNFVRFESKRVRSRFDELIRELDRPDPKALPPKRAPPPIDLSAPLEPSARLSNRGESV